MDNFTLYARREPTTDSVSIQYVPPRQLARLRDVVLYRDAQATDRAARIPWHYTSSIPRRSAKTIMLNCFRYRLQWIDTTGKEARRRA